jgi:hypothetical protein
MLTLDPLGPRQAIGDLFQQLKLPIGGMLTRLLACLVCVI